MEELPVTGSRTQAAIELHASVSPDRWCVTRANLEYLQQQVKDALLKGHIQPDEKDHFRRLDRAYGPSIYTVTEQHIKPVTFRAGKMSWALMLNPDGLDCHLFISHAWAEGIFEFLTKVKHSWPRGTHHAWCCMLANPQNLNIGAMLQSPSSSPFALALNAANVVLVVPNRHKSVYTRLWCAYEAYLSQEAGKPILIARTSTQARLMASMKYMSSSAALGCVLGLLARLYDWHSNRYVWMLALPAMLGTTIMDNKSRMIMHCFCEMYCWMELSDIYGFPTGHVWGFPDEMHTFVHTWFWVMVASFFCLLEVDRNEGRCNIREAEQLRDGYQGSIQYAECSQSTDAQNIMSEIGRRALNDVDFAIHVLLTAGMSTPALRKIALAGVDIEHAAYSEITAAVTMLGPFDVLTFSHMVFDLFYTKNELTNGELQALAILFRLLLLLLLWKSEIDDRFFLLKVLTKAVGFLLIMLLAVCCIAILKGTSPLFSWLLLSNVVMTFVVLLGFLGIEGTARIPCGLQILQIFFARGTKVFASCRTVEPVHLQNFYQSRSTILCDDDFFALFGHGGREDTSSGASDDPMDATQDEGSSDGELVQSSAVSC